MPVLFDKLVTYEWVSLTALHFLGHFVVELLGLLYFFCHGFLLSLVLLDELIGAFDLFIDHGKSVGKSSLDLLLLLVDHHSSHLFVDLCVFLQVVHLLEHQTVFRFLLKQTGPSLKELLSFFVVLVVLLDLIFDLILESFELELHL